MLEHAVRDVLNRTAPRRFAVLDPLKVVIENYPEGQVEEMEVVNNPEDPSAGSRTVPFTRELWIERDDFMEEPPAEVLPPGPGPRGAAAVRLLRDLSRGRQGRGRRRSSSCAAPTTRPRAAATRPTAAGPRRPSTGSRPTHAVPAEVRLYDHLFSRPDPGRGRPRPLRGPEPRLRDGAPRLPRGAGPRRRAGRRDRAVRAAGLLLARPRLDARPARLQPHAHPQGHVGQAPGAGPSGRSMTAGGSPR